MITAIVADDEPHARERLRELLARFGHFDIVAEARDGNEALQLIVTHRPQVAFLDINMPGVSVFQSIPSLQSPPLVVFQTAYAEHAAEAFDIAALDYLLKPIRFERLEQAVARILEKLQAPLPPTTPAASVKPAEQLAVTVGGKTRLIACRDILRISLEDGCCCLHLTREKILSDRYLNHFEEKLNDGRFLRTSRSDLINLSQIGTIHKEPGGGYTVVMRDGARIEVSRRKAQQLRSAVDF